MLCPSCGRTLEPAAQFCGECGTAVGGLAPPPPAPPLSTAPAPSPPGPATVPDLAPPPHPGATLPPGPDDGASSSQRWALWLLGALVVVIVAFVVSIVIYVLRDGDDDAAPIAPVPTTQQPAATTETTDAPTSTTTTVSSTAEPDRPEVGAAATTIDELCANAEALGAMFDEVLRDPFGTDADEVSELAAQLATDAARLSEGASPDELQRIGDCMLAMTATTP